MNVLVTGGAGFIGSAFVREALKLGSTFTRINKIFVLDSFTYAPDPRALLEVQGNSRLEIVKGKVENQDIVKKLTKEVDYIIHFAAESHVDRSINDPSCFIQSNILGSFSVLEAARLENKKILMVSTDEVYGSLATDFATEEFLLNPSSPYSSTKASGDLLAIAYAKTYKVNVRITRGANTYGPFQNPEKLIPNMILKIKNNKKIELYGNGTNIREWLHVEDHVAAIYSLLENDKLLGVFNISGNESFSNLEVAELVLSAFNKTKSEIVFIQDRKGHDFRYAQNSEKLRNSTGWSPIHTLKDFIPKMVTFY
jgi:dTDP-glucose 4,6-dehydratase